MPSVAVTVELAAVAAVVAPTVTLLLAPPFRRAAPGLALVGSVALAGWLVLAVVLAAVAPSLLLVVAVVTVVGASVWWLYTHPETHVRGLPPGTLGLRESNRALGERRRYLELAERLGPVFRTMQFGHRVACVAGLERTHRTLDRCSASLATASLPFTRDVTGGFLRYMDAGAHERYGPLFRRALARPVVAAAEDDVRAIVAHELHAAAVECEREREAVPPGPYLGRIAARAHLRILFGLGHGSRHHDAFLQAFEPLAGPITGHRLDEGQRVALAALRGVSRDQLAELDRSGDASVTCLGELRAGGEGMPDDVCLDNLVFVHKLGTSNLTGLLHWLTFQLGANPAAHAALRENGPRDAHVEAFVNETLRLGQSEYLFRTAATTFDLDGHTIPRGWKLRFCVWESHRDPTVFERPDEFDPGRWLGRDYTSSEFAPFGWGAHACNGIALTHAVARAVVETLVDDFDSVVTGGSPAVRDGRHWSHWRPSDDLRLHLTPRPTPA